MKLFKSIQQQYILLTSLLIIVLTAPILFSGFYLINRIIYNYSQKLMKIELDNLIKKAEKRYEKLKRFGLEDSEYHLKEVKELTIEDYKKFKFGKTGKVFVIKNDGTPILFFEKDTKNFLKVLKNNKKSLIEFNFKNHTYLIYYKFYPRWKSYIGIYVNKNEIFHSKFIFIRFIIIAFSIGLIIALFIVKFIRNKIIFPILELTNYANKIKEGNLDAKLKGKFYYEFADLKKAITIMVLSLKRMIEAYENQIEIVKNREKELNEEKEKLTTLLESISEGVIAADKNGKILFMNETAEELIGVASIEASKLNLCEVFVIKNSISTEELMSKAISQNKIIRIERNIYLITKNNSKKIPINLTASPLRDENKKTIGAVIVFNDITELLKIEEEIIKAEKLKTIGILAGGIAHDFNNLLSGIIGNIELLKFNIKNQNINSGILEKIEQIENASLRAQDLAYQLLTFSKGGEPIKKRTSLKNIIIDNAEFILRGSKIKFEYDIPDDLWDVEVDPGQISQVIQNIILNSKDAIKGEGLIKISCKNLPNYKPIPYEKSSNWVEIKIEDNGEGIPENIKNKIFEPFFTTKKAGSGLGLSICHSIVTKHGGTIEIESKENKGTVARILLPSTKEKKIILERGKSEKLKESNIVSEKLNVLVIDDNNFVREIYKEFLELLGHNVTTVSNGEKGIELYKKEKFDLIITDLTIPGSIGGEKVAQEILKINNNAKIIVSSGYSDDTIMANYKKYGFSGVLKKPIKLKELKQEIEKIFS